jgi:protein TonB
MAELGSEATPQPTPEPQPEPVGSGGGSGLSLGGAGGTSAAETGVPSDFQFSYYLQRMLALIESRWYKPPVPPGTRARVRYTILSSGRLEAIQLEESSGVPAFDRAALRALYAANPLPPLPPAYRKPSVTVHLTFSE